MNRVVALAAAIILTASRQSMANMTQNGTASITQSVTASSLTVTANGSSVFSITSSSGIHMQAGKIKLDSGAYLAWPDGTISTTATGFSLPRSTMSSLTSQFLLLNPPAAAWKKVTNNGTNVEVTLAMRGTHALVAFSCPVDVSGGGNAGLGFLVNSNYIDGESNGGTLVPFTLASAGLASAGFTHLTESTYTGDTTFSLIAYTAAPQLNIDTGSQAVCQFVVTEH